MVGGVPEFNLFEEPLLQLNVQIAKYDLDLSPIRSVAVEEIQVLRERRSRSVRIEDSRQCLYDVRSTCAGFTNEEYMVGGRNAEGVKPAEMPDVDLSDLHVTTCSLGLSSRAIPAD